MRIGGDHRKQIGALAALGLIGCGLYAGAATSADAWTLAVLLCAVLALSIATASGSALSAAARQHWLTLLAACGFAAYALALPQIAPSASDQGPFLSGRALAAFLIPAAAFGLGILTVRNRDDRHHVSALVLALAFGLAASALVWYWDSEGAAVQLRARAVSANATATTLGVLALLVSARLLRLAQRPPRTIMAQIPHRLRGLAILFVAPVTLFVLALTLGCLVLTGSRSGCVATIIGFAVFAALLALARRNGRPQVAKPAALFVIAAVIAAVLLAFGGSPALERLAHAPIDVEAREALLAEHWRIFLEAPLFGHGAFPGAENAHNIYLEALDEVGLAGLALLSLIVAPALIRAGQTAACNRSGAEWAAAACAGAVLALIQGSVSHGFQEPAIAALIMFSLGAFAGGQKAQRAGKEEIPVYEIARTAQAKTVHNAKLTLTARRSDK